MTTPMMSEVLGCCLRCNNYILVTDAVREFSESEFKMSKAIGSR